MKSENKNVKDENEERGSEENLQVEKFALLMGGRSRWGADSDSYQSLRI